jgi:hypothetical protein
VGWYLKRLSFHERRKERVRGGGVCFEKSGDIKAVVWHLTAGRENEEVSVLLENRHKHSKERRLQL